MGAVALTSLGLIGLAPIHHAAAESTGRITVNARACPVDWTYPLDCPLVDPGPVALYEIGGGTTLALKTATRDGLNWVWGDAGNVTLTSYNIGTDYMYVPEGFEISNVVALYGDGGGSEDGWYVAVSDDMPESEVSVIFTPYDPYTDADGDGATDASETVFGSDPYNPASFPYAQAGSGDETDSDGDGYSDDEETYWGTDPSDPSSYPTDESGLSDSVDSDGDGASDNSEIDFGSDPNDASSFPYAQAGGDETVDSDGDGASDDSELAFGSDPYDASDFPYAQAGPEDPTDSDGDGTTDASEIAWNTDPNDPSDYPALQGEQIDSDGDGATDDVELAYGSDPNDASDHPAPTAGSDHDNVANADEIAAVSSLPNTGSGLGEKSSGDGLLIGLGGLAAAGAYAARRARA